MRVTAPDWNGLSSRALTKAIKCDALIIDDQRDAARRLWRSRDLGLYLPISQVVAQDGRGKLAQRLQLQPQLFAVLALKAATGHNRVAQVPDGQPHHAQSFLDRLGGAIDHVGLAQIPLRQRWQDQCGRAHGERRFQDGRQRLAPVQRIGQLERVGVAQTWLGRLLFDETESLFRRTRILLPYGKLIDQVDFLPGLFGGTPAEVPELYHLGSPVNHVGSHCPPTLLLQGAHDMAGMVPDVRRLHRTLRKAGVTSVYVEFPGTDHAFDLVFPKWAPAAQAATYDIGRFLALMI